LSAAEGIWRHDTDRPSTGRGPRAGLPAGPPQGAKGGAQRRGHRGSRYRGAAPRHIRHPTHRTRGEPVMTTAFAAARRRDPLSQQVHLVDTISSIAPPPKAWTELRERWDTFVEFSATPLRDRLIEAVVNGSGDLPMLRALANAEAAPERADVVIEVRAEV